MYVILGCGTVGHSVADLLDARGKDVLIIDKSEERVESLQERGFDTDVHDITDLDSYADKLEEVEVALILTADDSRRSRPLRSNTPAWKRGGGSGRMASAGGKASVRRTAPHAPSSAAAAATPTARRITGAPASYRRTGNR